MKNYSKPLIYQDNSIRCEAICTMNSGSMDGDSTIIPGPAPTPTKKSCSKLIHKYQYDAIWCIGCSNRVSVPGWLTVNDYCGA